MTIGIAFLSPSMRQVNLYLSSSEVRELDGETLDLARDFPFQFQLSALELKRPIVRFLNHSLVLPSANCQGSGTCTWPQYARCFPSARVHCVVIGGSEFRYSDLALSL